MKSSVFSFGIVLALVAISYAVDAGVEVPCVSHNCLPPNQCASFAQSGSCPTQGHRCCKEVRQEFRTQCYHFGGECVTHRCNPQLVARQAQDCKSNEVCCILIN